MIWQHWHLTGFLLLPPPVSIKTHLEEARQGEKSLISHSDSSTSVLRININLTLPKWHVTRRCIPVLFMLWWTSHRNRHSVTVYTKVPKRRMCCWLSECILLWVSLSTLLCIEPKHMPVPDPVGSHYYRKRWCIVCSAGERNTVKSSHWM